MFYPITNMFINGTNRPGTYCVKKGLVVHSTDDPGATARLIRAYFENHSEAKASSHLISDWNEILELIPYEEVAWHAGPTANHSFIGLEICEVNEAWDDAGNKFDEGWKRAVFTAARVLKAFGWTIDQMFSHKWVSETYKETDHTDPYPYFEKWGRSWEEFVQAVEKEMGEQVEGKCTIEIRGRSFPGIVKDKTAFFSPEIPARDIVNAFLLQSTWLGDAMTYKVW